MDPYRHERLSEALREELTEMISYELSDPRVDSVTVTNVLVSPDGRRAEVRVSVAGDERRRSEAIEGLTHARTFLRRELAARLSLFRIPELQFQADSLGAEQHRLQSLLRRVRKGRPRPSAAPENNPVE